LSCTRRGSCGRRARCERAHQRRSARERQAEGRKRGRAPRVLAGAMARDPLIGTEGAGRVLIEAPLGRGGMGVVYRARQRSARRPVALKILAAELTTFEARVERFTREARLTASLRSPHTVTVHDFGRLDDGSLFIAMELLEGRSLQQI